ncbi:MAG: DMT family transporter [Pseudomonadota bacterium]
MIHLKLSLMALIWATSYPLGRYLAPYEAPYAIVVVRMYIAFAVLALLAWRAGEWQWRFSGATWFRFLVLGVSGFCIHNLLMFIALEHTKANVGAVINGAIPLAVVFLDYVIYRQKLRTAALLGVTVCFIGTAVVISHGDLAELVAGRIGFGELLFVIGACGWAIYTIAARPLLATLPTRVVVAYPCLIGAALVTPAFLVDFEDSIALLSDPVNLAIMVVQSLLTVAFGFLWYYQGVKAIGAAGASVYTNLIPVFAVIIAAFTIGEIPDMPLLIGGAMVVGGLLFVNGVQARDAT